MANGREMHMKADEKPMTSDDIKPEFQPEKGTEARDMLRKHEKIYSGKLDEIKVTEMRIDLIKDAKQFKSPRIAQEQRPGN